MSLNIIGGYLAGPRSFDVLCYQQDVQPTKRQQVNYIMKNLTCEQWGAELEQLKQIGDFIQDVHNEHSGVLRCILSLTLPGGHSKCGILVFVESNIDKLYHVVNFPEYLQEQLEEDIDEKKLKQLNYDLEISRALNAEEKKIANGAALASLMVNDDFFQSYIVFATND